MLTIKIHTPGEGYAVVPVEGEVSIFKDGDHEYTAHCLTLEKSHKEMMDTGQTTAKHKNPRAIVCFGVNGSVHTSYLYDDDRAWIMNANGKTVASV